MVTSNTQIKFSMRNFVYGSLQSLDGCLCFKENVILWPVWSPFWTVRSLYWTNRRGLILTRLQITDDQNWWCFFVNIRYEIPNKRETELTLIAIFMLTLISVLFIFFVFILIWRKRSAIINAINASSTVTIENPINQTSLWISINFNS